MTTSWDGDAPPFVRCERCNRWLDVMREPVEAERKKCDGCEGLASGRQHRSHKELMQFLKGETDEL